MYRIRRNLHIVVSCDPSNEHFRGRCEANPALFTRCSVQWLEPWSTKGLQQIAGAAAAAQRRLVHGCTQGACPHARAPAARASGCVA